VPGTYQLIDYPMIDFFPSSVANRYRKLPK
jgi:hypothetical protein